MKKNKKGEKPQSILMVSRILDSKDPVGSFTQRWAEVLAKKVDRLYFICLEAYDVTVKADNFEYYSMGKEKGYGRFRLLINYYRYLFRLMGKVDGFFGHMNSLYSILAFPVARLYKVKIVSWVAHMNMNITIKLNSHLSDIMITASQESLDVNPKKKKVLGHGIDVSRFKRDGNIDREKKIVTVGRITPVKDNETLINSVYMIANLLREKKWKVKIVGSSSTPESKKYKGDLLKLIDELNVSDLIDFVKPVANSQIPELLNSSSMFVNMQSKGGAGKAVLESMATETITVLCTDTFNDHLGEELTDLLIFKEKDPKSLAEKLKRIIYLDEKRSKEMGVKLRDIVQKHHNLDTLMDKIISLY